MTDGATGSGDAGPGEVAGGDARREPWQAVVVVHGVGNQSPMRTLRAFTFGLGMRRLFSSPDRVTGSADLRRLTEPPTRERRAHTDFYEFYWAHHMPDGPGLRSLVWLLRLLLRPEWRRRARGVAAAALLAQALALAGAAVVVAALVWCLAPVTGGGRPRVGPFGTVPWLVVAGLVVAVFHVLVARFLRTVLSDAVRYLDPLPANVEARRRIRADGLALLRGLHAGGAYDRIVVVGHSLGAVIAYDLLRSLWDELRHPDPAVAGEQRSCAEFDAAADALDPPVGDSPPMPPTVPATSPPPPPEAIDRFARAQHDLWRADRRDGVPWLVTDLVTLGAPLTHGSLLFADPKEACGGWPGASLAQRQALKEYPRCPPLHDELEPGRFYTRDYPDGAGGVRRLRVGHTAAPFGPTRWTNLYVPSRFIVRGDLLGGPVGPEFGPGVRDVPVRVPGRTLWARVRRFFPLAHRSYWWAPGAGLPDLPAAIVLPGPGGPAAPAPTALATALRLPEVDDVARPGTRPPARP